MKYRWRPGAGGLSRATPPRPRGYGGINFRFADDLDRMAACGSRITLLQVRTVVRCCRRRSNVQSEASSLPCLRWLSRSNIDFWGAKVVKEIEQALRALLGDPNLPEAALESALAGLLQLWIDHPAAPNVVEHAIRSWFASEASQRLQFCGPQISALGPNPAVTRVISLPVFVTRFIRERHMTLSPEDLERVARRIEKRNLEVDHDPTQSPTGVTWVFLDEELGPADFNDIESCLLPYLPPWTSFVAISYRVETSELHVPTVLDAGFAPSFVAKTHAPGALPKAWDWKERRWGLSEMVHRSGVKAWDVKVRLLGRTTEQPRGTFSGLKVFAPPYAPVIEDTVAQILRQMLAHERLQPFVVGAQSILELSANEFEHFVARLHERRGYQTRVTRASRDGGFDVIAFSDTQRRTGLLIQAKHTCGSVGIRIIRELIGARFLAEEEYSHYMLVVATTGRFSRPAQGVQEQYPTLLRLLDFNDLQDELRAIANLGVRDIVRDASARSRMEVSGSVR